MFVDTIHFSLPCSFLVTIQVIHLGLAVLRYEWRYPIITGVVDKPIALFFKDCQSWLNSYLFFAA